ncbi:MAG: redoxin domain-containing protein [Candidatus Rokubacteria bacterium]|nr:redoxin domain-containing protein [Candidatus Rokubacteria bacterium]
MMRAVAALLAFVAMVGLPAPGRADSPDPFEALGLVRFGSGIKAPDFALKALTGEPVSLSSPSGSAALLVFWATW